ncbi:tRNA-dihydrouridine(47) synthase [NAD(P)(+)]-like [Crassostrea angulata]|uniref:tRNA-dihydrouridine(47) synthase [NAD(P)(+)]-like n=1 Tax=Magallana angulata TaxID=2784310 RepID=UPI0022B215E8|nr:tRNA-dihydrouridine(47) synthase [NAD(P)(+)]-like [Crassostrea angulata]XP_052683374.1 tRNA-dihydrouridine(47) synthase [NAD(P)(+)]-like [Crassostrea angulata]XP_052683375.1 tRNA-dihydrouridine(47) synthase [NAD(P)(+)]-like [Crassostrea angulata]
MEEKDVENAEHQKETTILTSKNEDKADSKDAVKAGANDKQPQKSGREEKPGFARIKSEFVRVDYKPELDTAYISQKTKDELEKGQKRQLDGDQDNGKGKKKMKVKGRNKQRPVTHIKSKDKLCPTIFQEKECSFGEKCKFSHDIKGFMESKPKDIGLHCFMFETYGKCPYGLACRYGSKHISEDFKNIVNQELYEKKSKVKQVLNVLSKDLQVMLWKKRYNFDKANEVVKQVQKMAQEKLDTFSKKCVTKQENKETATKSGAESEEKMDVTQDLPSKDAAMESTDESEGEIKLRPQETRKIDFSSKNYLAPLTTVGNLPFRRICKTYGADITCSEMAMSMNLLQGQASEWALLKRHESEDLFGVQICGGWADTLTRCSQLINENVELDFLDLNCGCPIDLVYKKGEGCALIGRLNKFEQIIRGMNSVLDVPLTVKMRTGIFDNKNIAHTVIPKLRDWGVSMVTLHGRSREQRYTRLADWDYINQCAEAGKPMPVFGNGDILSYEDLDRHLKNTKVTGCMVARGALIKPWIFTELKEKRHWDISSSERFDMMKRFVNNGLEHWGSDTQGVETTRRFLLEWQSFLHRYIPVGLLEQLPQKINERPPYYIGRNDLETLMSSPNCGDWVKISEMLLGPVPDGFSFLPKHKANAYK